MQGLGDLSGGIFQSNALAVSADGSSVVGWGITDIGYEAFVWDSIHGMRNLKSVLINDFGLELTDWQIKYATGISADGTKIVGSGINPDGNTEGWVATIPEPCSLLLLAIGSLILRKRF